MRAWWFSLLSVLLTTVSLVESAIPRYEVVTRYNPVRNATNYTTPMQVGNGFFAFGADVSGLQTFQPWAVMSDWGWKNDTLPTNVTMEDILTYRGVVWDGVQYEFDGPAEAQQWLIANPNRANLGRIGLLFKSEDGSVLNVTEGDISNTYQALNLWTGIVNSMFTVNGSTVQVQTFAAQDTSTVAFTIHSELVQQGRVGVFLDFPWNDGSEKFQDPYVGYWDDPENHTTTLTTGGHLGRNVLAQINHTMVAASFYTSIGGGDAFVISRDSLTEHRYSILPNGTSPSSSFSLAVAYSLDPTDEIPAVAEAESESTSAWGEYWANYGFVDVITGSTDSRAEELQRRIILSRYLMRVNEAGYTPPQESGLFNDGWYGKFHMEMFFWHSCHWALWNNWDLLSRSLDVYHRFLPTSIERAQVQESYKYGARWSKMTDPTGRSAPGEINELLIWQQPHPLMFAEYEYRETGSQDTLERWHDIVYETAAWMADYAHYNDSTGFYDLGPPMYVVSEDTSPNATRNPAFELAYWNLGLERAQTWLERLGENVPEAWIHVRENLAPLPIEDGLYAVYEGIPDDFWAGTEYTNNHPALVGLYGWLPKTSNLSIDIAFATAERVWTSWNISNLWGWDFPMLAMSAARNNDTEQAVDWLLDTYFQFDDVGMPLGGAQVPTPYFPGSGGLLYAIAMMAGGWDGSTEHAPGFPREGWEVTVENISRAM